MSDSVVIEETHDSLGSLDFVRDEEDEAYDQDLEAPTATALPSADPATLDKGPQTIPREALPDTGRVELPSLSFEEDTRARAIDERPQRPQRPQRPRRYDDPATSDPDFGVDYESLPSLEVRRPYDAYEEAFAEREPVTQIHREGADSVQEPSFPAPITTKKSPDSWGRREESGPRERPAPKERPQSSGRTPPPVPVYDEGTGSAQWGRDEADPTEAEQVEEEEQDHPAFMRGVQPIRTATPDAWAQPMPPAAGQYLPSPMLSTQLSPEPSQPHFPPAHAQQVHPSQMPQQGYAQAPHPPPQPSYYPPPHGQVGQVGPSYPPAQVPHMAMHGSAMPPAMQSMQFQAQTSGAYPQSTAAGIAARAGRSAWFVAGAAFGIMFAFFATGLFNGKADPAPVAPVATMTAAAPPVTVAPPAQPGIAPVGAVAQPAAAQPAAAPVFAQQPAVYAQPGAVAQPGAPVLAPVAPAAVAPSVPAGFFPVVAAPQPAPVAAPQPTQARVAAAPPARPAPRVAPRPAPRRAPQVSSAPKNLGGGGAGADDAPSPPSGGGDVSDLLGAGLNP